MATSRRVDALVAEIGSTVTLMTAFDGLTGEAGAVPELVGQGMAPTSVAAGDVGIGLKAARAALEAQTGPLAPDVILAASSAAGGLRMTVHGLTAKMTAAAAREAALGAGAVVTYQTAGLLRDADLEKVDRLQPNLMLLAGGVEGGDYATVLANAERLTALRTRPVVVYGGNSIVSGEVRGLLEQAGFVVRVTANVYPAIDELDVIPARAAIHDAFEEHIVHAPGMERVREFVSGAILPTPGAVLVAAELLADAVGDLVVIDVGGATTDVHSVTDGSPELAQMALDPQPRSKRTVEGDLGTFVSAEHTAAMLDAATRPEHLPPAVPRSDEDVASACGLARFAAVTATVRHAGVLSCIYTPTGRRTVARGRDLTACRLLVGTGGALTRLPGGIETLESARSRGSAECMLPPADARCVLDSDYVLACCGVLAKRFGPGPAVALMRRSIGI